MKSYTERINELNKSQSEMSMEEFLKDDRGCWVEGETSDGKQIWSCPRKYGIGITTFKIIGEDGKLKVKFNEVDEIDLSSDKLISLEGMPNKARKVSIFAENIKNLDHFTKHVKHVELSNIEELTSLEGLPKQIEGNLHIFFCPKLTTLKGIPEYIGGNLKIEHTKITDLEYFPKYVGGDVIFNENRLTSIKGMVKKVKGTFKLNKEKHLTSLEGGPVYVKRLLSLTGTDNLESYNGFPQNEPDNDWHGSDGPSDIETDFILDSRYINNTKPDYEKINKEIRDKGLDPNVALNNYKWEKFYKKLDEPRYINYWEELLEYVLRKDKSKISTVKWPKDFINKQSGEIKNLMMSSRGLKKFNIDK